MVLKINLQKKEVLKTVKTVNQFFLSNFISIDNIHWIGYIRHIFTYIKCIS